MSVRALFNNRGTKAKPRGKSKRSAKKRPNMRVVARDGKTVAPRRANPEDAAIPWKTILATTLVTSMVSTVGVTLARYFLDRASERRKILSLTAAQDHAKALEAQQAPQAQAFQPNPGHHRQPPMFDEAPRGIPAHPPRRALEVVNTPQSLPRASFEPNPFAPSQVRQVPLPEAPHAPRSDSQDEPPAWFQRWLERQGPDRGGAHYPEDDY